MVSTIFSYVENMLLWYSLLFISKNIGVDELDLKILFNTGAENFYNLALLHLLPLQPCNKKIALVLMSCPQCLKRLLNAYFYVEKIIFQLQLKERQV